jgi:transcriptional regulator with XRE-family HTH domain
MPAMALTSTQQRIEIGKRLKALRIASGYERNQKGFVDLIGIAPNAWSQYEAGTRLPTLDQADKIVVATGVTLDWIYRGNVSGLPHHIAVKLGGVGTKDSLSA